MRAGVEEGTNALPEEKPSVSNGGSQHRWPVEETVSLEDVGSIFRWQRFHACEGA